mgnify:CR=1 FL=1
MKLGIVGLPNVGKSTLFNAITKKNILAANYPFATIDPNVGVVTVPDKRVEVLENMPNDEIADILDELDDDETTWLFVKIYPSSVITTPEPVALAVPSDIP